MLSLKERTIDWDWDRLDAGRHYAGQTCYLCEKRIQKDEPVRYYGGPFVMHASCIETLLYAA